MRKEMKIPRILKINWIKDHSMSVIFSNGESRIIDFKSVLTKIGIDNRSPAWILYQSDELLKAEIQNYTISWRNVNQYITLKNNEKKLVPFEIGADVLFKESLPEKSDNIKRIGRLIKESRIDLGMTQQDLARKSGTSRNYISRIENDRSDIEVATLRKIVEAGLGKELEINVK